MGAFIFRVPDLAKRPMHTDEAVHALKLGELLNAGTYSYNPHEYHGPIHYYCSLPLVWMSGARTYAEIPSEVPLRMVTVLFGTGLVLLLLLISDGLGRRAALIAALLTAISPAMVYYSRYYIQEIILVFFTFGAMVAIWRYVRSPRIGWALLTGAFLGLAHATKETCVIAYGAMAASILIAWLWAREIQEKPPGSPLAKFKVGHVLPAVLLGLFISVFFMTGHFTNLQGAVDSVTAYGAYFSRAVSGDSSTNGASVHHHPWNFYLHILLGYHEEAGPVWNEAIIVLLAIVGIVLSLTRKTSLEGNADLHRFFAIYTIAMTFIYCMLPYKTPWNMLGFLHGMILMAGIGASEFYGRLPKAWWIRMPLIALFLFGAWQLGNTARLGSTIYSADTRNPYVYGHTSSNFLRVGKRLEDLAKIHPDGHQMEIDVLAPGSDYWPLPWDLRRFDPDKLRLIDPAEEAYFETPSEGPLPSVVIAILHQESAATPYFQEDLDKKFGTGYFQESYGFRPGVSAVVYIKQPLWDAFIETRSKKD